MEPAQSRYRRVMVKLSGEALMGSQPFGIEPAVVRSIAHEVAEVAALDVQVAVVVGGHASGVFFRRAPDRHQRGHRRHQVGRSPDLGQRRSLPGSLPA